MQPAFYPAPPPSQEDLQSSLAALALGPSPQRQPHQHHHKTPSSLSGQIPPPPQNGSHYPINPPQRQGSQSNPSNADLPSLTAPLPTVSQLTTALAAVQTRGADPTKVVAWCRDVISLLNRAETLNVPISNRTSISSADALTGPLRIEDPQLIPLVNAMTALILEVSNPQPMPKPAPLYVAEAVYLRAQCEATGAFASANPPIKKDPRTAFRDFEFAGRNGFAAAWFKIGRDYENFGDIPHAKDAFERGVKAGDERCLYVSFALSYFGC